MTNITLCPKCGTGLECLGGRSAHQDNWYCPNENCGKVKAMTNPPVVTAEEALEILNSIHGLNTSGFKYCLSGNDGLAAFANAVIAAKFGEPVAWAEAGRESNVIADLVKQTNKNDWVKPYTVALYALKESK